MRVPQPQLVPLQGGIDGLDAIMKKLKADQNNMIMLIDEKFQKSHGTSRNHWESHRSFTPVAGMLKLLETRHGLLTQHVTAKNAFQGGAATQTNIMNKFNCKVFGLNYKPIIENVAYALFAHDDNYGLLQIALGHHQEHHGARLRRDHRAQGFASHALQNAREGNPARLVRAFHRWRTSSPPPLFVRMSKEWRFSSPPTTVTTPTSSWVTTSSCRAAASRSIRRC